MSVTSGNTCPTPWDDCPTVWIPIADCPHCGALAHAIIRTDQHGDGSKTRKCVCGTCGGRFKISLEVPVSGNDVVWPVQNGPGG